MEIKRDMKISQKQPKPSHHWWRPSLILHVLHLFSNPPPEEWAPEPRHVYLAYMYLSEPLQAMPIDDLDLQRLGEAHMAIIERNIHSPSFGLWI